MDVNKSFRFVFDDNQWIKKLLIGLLMSLLSFLILPALIMQGYLIAIIRRVMLGNWDDLPEWAYWGKLLKDGFFITVAQIVYTLPFTLLLVVGGMATGGLGVMANNGSGLATAGMLGGGLLLVCLSLLFAIAFLFLAPALTIQYAIKDDFGSLFKFGEVWEIIRNHTADILIAFLVTVVASMVLSLLVGMVSITVILIPLAILLGFVTSIYISLVTGHLYGQIAAKVFGNKAHSQNQSGVA